MASNDMLTWTQLYYSQLNFEGRKEEMDFLIGNNQSFKHYSLTFRRKTTSSTMHLGNYGLVQAYTRECTAKFHSLYTSENLVPYDYDDNTSGSGSGTNYPKSKKGGFYDEYTSGSGSGSGSGTNYPKKGRRYRKLAGLQKISRSGTHMPKSKKGNRNRSLTEEKADFDFFDRE